MAALPPVPSNNNNTAARYDQTADDGWNEQDDDWDNEQVVLFMSIFQTQSLTNERKNCKFSVPHYKMQYFSLDKKLPNQKSISTALFAFF